MGNEDGYKGLGCRIGQPPTVKLKPLDIIGGQVRVRHWISGKNYPKASKFQEMMKTASGAPKTYHTADGDLGPQQLP